MVNRFFILIPFVVLLSGCLHMDDPLVDANNAKANRTSSIPYTRMPSGLSASQIKMRYAIPRVRNPHVGEPSLIPPGSQVSSYRGGRS